MIIVYHPQKFLDGFDGGGAREVVYGVHFVGQGLYTFCTDPVAKDGLAGAITAK